MFQGRCDDGSLNNGIVITSGNRLDERCLRALVTSAFLCWCGYTSGWTCCARPTGPMVPRAHSYHWGCSTAVRSDIPVPKQDLPQEHTPPTMNNNREIWHCPPWYLPSNAIQVWQVSARRVTGRQNNDSDVSVRGSLGGLRGSPSDCSPHRLAKLRTRPHTMT